MRILERDGRDITLDIGRANVTLELDVHDRAKCEDER
jgi:hypothetical protein